MTRSVARKYPHRPSVGMSNTLFLSVEIEAGAQGRSFEDMARVLIQEALATRRGLPAPDSVDAACLDMLRSALERLIKERASLRGGGL